MLGWVKKRVMEQSPDSPEGSANTVLSWGIVVGHKTLTEAAVPNEGKVGSGSP